MSSLHHSDNVLVAPVNNRTMHLPIQLQGIKKTVDTTTLINSGATGNFINPHLLPSGIFKLSPIPSPITTYNIDGTPNNGGTIHWTTVISFTSRSFTDTIKFMVIQLSCPQIILGMPWLQKWIPRSIGECLPLIFTQRTYLSSLILKGLRGLFVSTLP